MHKTSKSSFDFNYLTSFLGAKIPEVSTTLIFGRAANHIIGQLNLANKTAMRELRDKIMMYVYCIKFPNTRALIPIK